MKDLYRVEMLMNYLADGNIIIHESISTGAEVGLFLSEEAALEKTCVLLPDDVAVEEDKMGAFLRLAFLRSEPKLKEITYYPRVEKNIISENVKHWHTFFYRDRVGENLGYKIEEFMNGVGTIKQLRFSTSKDQMNQGTIRYETHDKELTIYATPRVLMICLAAVFNIDEVEKQVINAKAKTLSEYVNILVLALQEVFSNTIMEKTGKDLLSCSIKGEMNVKGVYIAGIVGMCMYLFQAAEFIEIQKESDYLESGRVTIKRKMVRDESDTPIFFYKKYKNCVGEVVGKRIL